MPHRPAPQRSVAPLPDPATLLASLLAMMTRFSCLGCPRLAGRIRRRLALLPHYADDAMPPLVKQLACRLEDEWAQLQAAISDAGNDDPDPDTDPAERTVDAYPHPASPLLH